MELYKVALMDVGEMASVDLNTLSWKLNALQRSFQFSTVSPIPSEALGDPDVQGQWYNIRRLFDHINAHPRSSDYDFLVGITAFKMTDRRDPRAKTEKDYFSFSDLQKASVVSVNPSVLIHKSESKSIYQYISFLMMGELLCNITKKYLLHDTIHGCLFDECEDRSSLIQGIEAARICEDRIAAIKTVGVAQLVIDDVHTVLNWCSRNTWHFAIGSAAKNPFVYFSIALGAGFSWLASEFITKFFGLFVFLFSLVPPLVILYRYKLSHKATKFQQSQ